MLLFNKLATLVKRGRDICTNYVLLEDQVRAQLAARAAMLATERAKQFSRFFMTLSQHKTMITKYILADLLSSSQRFIGRGKEDASLSHVGRAQKQGTVRTRVAAVTVKRKSRYGETHPLSAEPASKWT